ncbi:MAG: acetate--CoA ligase family protein [Desulfatibacillaceae bacterium]|nr:acetate--CoA ligase family protein [Desulfatibacillaceae bacterium]
MNFKTILDNARQKGLSTLDEASSKAILTEFGVPVVKEMVAASPDEAVRASEKFGFPVVVKGLGSSLAHKSEAGLVHTGLGDSKGVLAAALAIQNAAGDALEGFLVQPQVKGRREFVAGLFFDRQFGPVVMFGMGGVLTEALKDVAFRLAPVTRGDVDSMLEELSGRALLGPFRGEAAVDRDAIFNTLSGLCRLANEAPEVSEVDINPLIAQPNGSLVAVDALVVLGKRPSAEAFRKPVSPRRVGAIFHPRSIAFVGATARFGKWGHMVSTAAIGGGFKGDIYLVNPKGGTILGRQAYKTVSDLPDGVDLAVVTIPAAGVMELIGELAKKKIRSMVLITSGFGEVGADGKALERQLAQEAEKQGVLILGPNTMGITNPHIDLFCMGSHIRTKPGSTALVAQSGNMGAQLMAFAMRQGIGIRAFCGSGNEAMISIEDYMDCFEVDDLTRTVVLYLESVKDGRRFFESAKRVGAKKPVVVLKGGRTEAGRKAAMSHTGAMASDIEVFNAACCQAGIVQVNQPMDMLDLSAAFSSLPLPHGNRVAIMTLGGGWGVVTADLCNENGLEVVPLSDEVFAKIDKLLPPFWSRSNPIDLVGENDPNIPREAARILMEWDGCDAVLNLGIMGRRHAMARMIENAVASDPNTDEAGLREIHKILCGIEEQYALHLVELMETYNKPILGVPLVTDDSDKTLMAFEGRKYEAVFFKTPERAVRSLAKMYEYSRFLDAK